MNIVCFICFHLLLQLPLLSFQNSGLHSAVEAYDAGDYNLAEQLFAKEAEGRPLNSLEAPLFFSWAVCMEKNGKFADAEAVLVRLLDLPEHKTLSADQIRLLLAKSLLGSQKTVEARPQFEILAAASTEPNIRHLATLYLIKLDLNEGGLQEAERLLQALSTLPESDPLRFEWAYLYGKLFFEKRQWQQAAAFLRQALPQKNQQKAEWYADTLYFLGTACLKSASNEAVLEEALQHLQALLAIEKSERAHLAFGQCALALSERSGNLEMRELAEAVLSNASCFTSQTGQMEALLLRAEAAPTYKERALLYEQLTAKEREQHPEFARSWFLRGCNDFQEKEWSAAEKAFAKAHNLLVKVNATDAALAKMMQIKAAAGEEGMPAAAKALSLLEHWMAEQPDAFRSLEHPDEARFLQGKLYTRLGKILEAEAAFKQVNAEFADQALLFQAKAFFQADNTEAASRKVQELIKRYPDSPLAPEAWMLFARLAEQQKGGGNKPGERYRVVFERYPGSPFAPEAYFFTYSYRDYLMGERDALRHLQAMESKFPDSPYIIVAFYLRGLNSLQDRKTAEGKWISKRNLLDAIAYFDAAEACYEKLSEAKQLTANADYFLSVCQQAKLERGLANWAVAEESIGAKRNIYLDYSAEVFAGLATVKALSDESNLYLAQVYRRQGKLEDTLATLNRLTTKTPPAKDYFLSLAYAELGELFWDQEQHAESLAAFVRAEALNSQNCLTAEQKLTLWIRQSDCYRALGKQDAALLTLSKVVNDDAVSGLRLKAMFLRGEIYAGLGKHELARKQWEATAKKGGEWGKKAQEKLDEEYGYH